MTTTINSFESYRKKANMPLHDIAYLLGMDISNLSKAERGKRNIYPSMILLYHSLFNAPLDALFDQHYHQLQQLWLSRALQLIEHIRIQQPPLGKNRIYCLKTFIETITNTVNQHSKSYDNA